FDFENEHEDDEEDDFYGRDFKNFTSRFFPRSNCASEIHSSDVCAWATSPGPNTMLGMPPADRTAASQKKWTPSGFFWPAIFMNCWTNGSRWSVSRGRAGAIFLSVISADKPLARRNCWISRFTRGSVSPGMVRRSIV